MNNKKPSELSKEEYISQEVNEARFYARRGTDRGGNRIYCPSAYIAKTEQNAKMRYALRGRDNK